MELHLNMNDVSETAFLTLQCHAQDARSRRPFLNDTSSVRATELLYQYFSTSGHSLHRNIWKKRLSSNLVAHLAIRAKKYDHYIRSFLDLYPEAAVVNIGCGLDHRFERVDNGKLSFYDLDLPDIMNIKRQIFPPEDRYTQMAQSVFDFEWIDHIQNDHVMLVAEGVFMYCREQDVRELFFNLRDRLRNPEIVFEVFNSKWMKGWRRGLTEFKLKKSLKMGEGAGFRFGIPDSDAIERWGSGMRLLDEWSYMDSDELSSPLMKLMRRNNSFRKVQWTVHYQLGTAAHSN